MSSSSSTSKNYSLVSQKNNNNNTKDITPPTMKTKKKLSVYQESGEPLSAEALYRAKLKTGAFQSPTSKLSKGLSNPKLASDVAAQKAHKDHIAPPQSNVDTYKKLLGGSGNGSATDSSNFVDSIPKRMRRPSSSSAAATKAYSASSIEDDLEYNYSSFVGSPSLTATPLKSTPNGSLFTSVTSSTSNTITSPSPTTLRTKPKVIDPQTLKALSDNLDVTTDSTSSSKKDQTYSIKSNGTIIKGKLKSKINSKTNSFSNKESSQSNSLISNASTINNKTKAKQKKNSKFKKSDDLKNVNLTPIDMTKLFKGAEKSAETRLNSRLQPERKEFEYGLLTNTTRYEFYHNLPTALGSENPGANDEKKPVSRSRSQSIAKSRSQSIARSGSQSIARSRSQSIATMESFSSFNNIQSPLAPPPPPTASSSKMDHDVTSPRATSRTPSRSNSRSASIIMSRSNSKSNSMISSLKTKQNTTTTTTKEKNPHHKDKHAHRAAYAVRNYSSMTDYEKTQLDFEKERDEYLKHVTSKGVITAAQSNVDEKLRNLDQNLSNTFGQGKRGVNLFGNEKYNQAAITKAQEIFNKQINDPNRNKIDMGSGLFLSQEEIDDIAAKMLSPVLDEVSSRAEQQRKNDLDIHQRAEKNSNGFLDFKNLQILKDTNDKKVLDETTLKHKQEFTNTKNKETSKFNKLVETKEKALSAKQNDLNLTKKKFKDTKDACKLKMDNHKKRLAKKFANVKKTEEENLASLQKEQDIMIVNIKTQLEIAEKKQKDLNLKKNEIISKQNVIKESVDKSKKSIEDFDQQIHSLTVELIQITNETNTSTSNNENIDEELLDKQEIIEDKLSMIKAKKAQSKASLALQIAQLKQLQTDSFANSRNIQINNTELNFKREQLHSIRDIQNEIDIYSTEDDGDDDIMLDATSTRTRAMEAGEVYEKKKSQYAKTRLETPLPIPATNANDNDLDIVSDLIPPSITDESDIANNIYYSDHPSAEESGMRKKTASHPTLYDQDDDDDEPVSDFDECELNTHETQKRSWASRFLLSSGESKATTNDDKNLLAGEEGDNEGGIENNSPTKSKSVTNTANDELPADTEEPCEGKDNDVTADQFSGFSQGTLPDVNNENVEDEDDPDNVDAIALNNIISQAKTASNLVGASTVEAEAMGRDNSYFKEVF
ncbi:hypothetical protein TBLA_0G01870 [Henningerozyma blattae CBS 6284]|uniref:Uncharacterized protein n=1 Tax=Henningerozyma blattae (strain ATCC 34711 / CBS 6284 / DSM 70876 / NBRC 10599 / NRRL Y-10934 / UCD 77-7) TaxID=1071380 RepID=I2H6X8_HENB6|nr:hypothetical protein TBLA_0G01870 [Tetrapisispora blattae CBS 6284]CCH62130.1 hypothetical protein TBLA_0G01870 [Tetrapisispora blattae CBS 6284]